MTPTIDETTQVLGYLISYCETAKTDNLVLLLKTMEVKHASVDADGKVLFGPLLEWLEAARNLQQIYNTKVIPHAHLYFGDLPSN